MACLICAHPTLTPVGSFADYAAAAKLAPDERAKLYAYIESHPEAAFERFDRCAACGFTQVVPLPSLNTLITFYQNYYASGAYAGKRDKKIARTLRRLNRLRPYVASGRFLDVGCNVGFAVEAARMAGFAATGIEIDAAAAAYASEHFSKNQYIATPIDSYTPDAPFDLVHCTEVIEHVVDPVGFMGHLARVTKAGGYLFLTTPDAGHWRRPARLVDWPETKPLEHITWQTKRSLTHLLNAQGFDVVRFAFNLKPGLRVIARRRSA